MPRPKVRPEDRKRSCKACVSCKASKIRCDSRLPCATCVRRGQSASCVYSGTDRRRRPRHSDVTSHQSTRSSEDPSTGIPLPVDASPIHTPLGTVSSDRNRPLASSSGRSGRYSIPDSRPLASSTKEKIQVRETSSSFLHFLRKTLRSYVGLVPFTDGDCHSIMLDAEITPTGAAELEPSPEEMYSLLDSYFEASSGLLDLFTADEVDLLISTTVSNGQASSHSSMTEIDAASLYTALAIGAQVRPLGDPSSRIELDYFCRAQRVAFENMLTSQSLSMVRLFLLLAFYMIGACRRNTASIYLGIAARTAIVLSLHNPANYGDINTEEYNNRIRIWNSLRNVDILSSFILGKPRNLPTTLWHEKNDHAHMEFGSIIQYSQAAFSEIVKACSLLENIVDKLSTGNMLHIPTAEALLEQFRRWSQSLPPVLLKFTFLPGDGASLDPVDRQLLIGNIHVSCVYYFSVILITRPFLIAYLLSRLRGRAPDQLISDPDEASDINIKNNKVSKLAQVCVSSAIYMVNMCQTAKSSNFFFGNLCLLKAWIFGAGLVLGFSMFAGEPRKDIDESLENARDILNGIAPTSPQATLYCEILDSFAEAIQNYHSRISAEIHDTVQHYMNQILVFDNLQEERTANQSYPAEQDMPDIGIGPSVYDLSVTLGDDTMPYEQTEKDNCDTSIVVTDDFLLDTEPLERLFYSVE